MGVTIQRALVDASQLLEKAGVTEARLQAGSLLGHVIACNRTFIVAHPEYDLNSESWERFHALVARRAAGEPLQYLTQRQEFFGLEFEVTPDVLIPRPESELIVECVVALLPKTQAARFADIGTGSGCLAISILHELPAARGWATDISNGALKVAERNAERNGVGERLTLITSDLYAAMPGEEFDLIVSNPPYIPEAEFDSLQREVKHEPMAALIAGPDGLAVIRRLLSETPKHLRTNGQFIFEIGFGQGEAVQQLIDHTKWKLIEIRNDLQDIPRTVVLERK